MYIYIQNTKTEPQLEDGEGQVLRNFGKSSYRNKVPSQKDARKCSYKSSWKSEDVGQSLILG